MLQKFEVSDEVLGQSAFMTDEVQYNLIHRICESGRATCLKTCENTMIFAQSEGQNAWLWLSKELAGDQRAGVMQELLPVLKGIKLPGVTGSSATVKQFARLYSEAHDLQYSLHMTMESYFCPAVKRPIGVNGTIRKATRYDVEAVAGFLAGFSDGAYGVTVDPAAQIPAAEGIIDNDGLYLWMVGSRPVSMANIAQRAPRHARINAVYTPPAFRKKGYASAVVAELCAILEAETGLVPMLYADTTNPDSNKVYRNVGFVESGKVVDIKFNLINLSQTAELAAWLTSL